MLKPGRLSPRFSEAILLAIVFAVAVMGFALVAAGLELSASSPGSGSPGPAPLQATLRALPAPLFVCALFSLLHLLLSFRRMRGEQIMVPLVALLFSTGLVMIFRLQGAGGAWQQLLRGLLPGMALIWVLVQRPPLVETLRRWAVPISLVGLALPFATALFGVVDETGARLALKLGPLPAIQTTEFVKVSLIVFLAWFIDREGRRAEGRARPLFGWLRLPGLHYFLPGALFVALSILALVAMSDFGAVLIMACLFVGMLYAGFDTRVFATIASIGLVLALLAGLALAFTWEIPTVIRYRFLAFQDPWSTEPILIDGQPAGITVSEGPGYQIQQAIYAITAGGLSGTGLGLGSPEYVPLAHSDFIYAAIIEEMGAAIGIAVLIVFAMLFLRILRVAILLPASQVFERLLVTGIAIHFFTQVFIMAGGTLNLLPLTGITIPFLSLGGTSLLVNLAETGLVLAIAQRLEGQPE